MDENRRNFIEKLKNDKIIIEVNPAGEIKQLEYLSRAKDIPNGLIFINEKEEKVSRILDDAKLNNEIGPTKFFLNPEDAVSYCNRLYLQKLKTY